MRSTRSPFRQPSENEEDFEAMLYRKPLDTLKSLYDEACAARDAANDTPSWDYLDRRCARLAREIDDFVRGRANAINAGNY